MGVRAFGVRLDVSDEAAVQRAAAEVESTFGDLHILSNNAGVTFAGSPLLGVPQQQLDWIFGVNVFGTLHCCRAFVPLIQKHGQGGHIVNTASIGGLQVNPLLRNGPYAMTKYAVVAMSETLALDLDGHRHRRLGLLSRAGGDRSLTSRPSAGRSGSAAPTSLRPRPPPRLA